MEGRGKGKLEELQLPKEDLGFVRRLYLIVVVSHSVVSDFWPPYGSAFSMPLSLTPPFLDLP